MTKIRARVTLANRARTVRIGRTLVRGVTRTLDEHAALACVEARVSRSPRRQHAVHHVDAERNVVGHLLRFSNAHQVARTIVRQKRSHFPSHLASERVRFADGEATHRISRKTQLDQLAGTFADRKSN